MKNKLPNLHLLKGKPNQSKYKKQLVDWLESSGAPTENKFRTALNLHADLSLKLKDFEILPPRKSLARRVTVVSV